jgi:hypothetical protein
MNLYPIVPTGWGKRTPTVNGQPATDASALKPVLIHYSRMGVDTDRLIRMNRPAGQLRLTGSARRRRSEQ